MKNLSDKISYFFLSFIMLAIIVSFAFTGFEGFSGSSNSVATVDGTPVTRQEFNQAYNMLISRMSPDKSLTSKQIRDFGIRERALQSVIEQKHILNFASSLDFKASPSEVKSEIRELPYFKTGNKFDLNKYRQLLAVNKLSPAKFEEQIIDQIKTQKLQALLSAGIFSDTYVKEKLKFEKYQANAWVMSFAKEDMVKNIKVPKAKIDSFVNDENNKSTLESLYKTYQARTLAKKEKVKTLDQVKRKIAKEHLQKISRKELGELHTDLTSKIQAAMEGNKLSELKRLKSQYGLNFQEKYALNPLNYNFRDAKFETDTVLNLFKEKDLNTVLKDENSTHITFVKVKEYTNGEVKEKDFKKEIQTNKNFALFTLQSAILKYAEKNSKVTTKVNF